MSLCSTCKNSTVLVFGIKFNGCDHVICSFCALRVLTNSLSTTATTPQPLEQNDNTSKRIQCPSKFMFLFYCNGFVSEDELTLLLREVRRQFSNTSANTETMVKNVLVPSSALAPALEPQIPRTSRSARGIFPSSPKSEAGGTFIGASQIADVMARLNRALSDMSIDDHSMQWSHHDMLVRKLTQERGMSREHAILFIAKLPIIENQKPIYCRICLTEGVPAGEGVVLRGCLHYFCKECISGHISAVDTANIQCPFVEERSKARCDVNLFPSEVKALVSQNEYERHLVNLLIQETEASIPKAFHCRTPDCQGFCIEEGQGPTRKFFRCRICHEENCLECKALHSYRIPCDVYRKRIEDEENRKEQMKNERISEQTINERIAKGELQRCPKCKLVIEKNQGCRDMQCKKCKHQFRWEGLMT